MTYENCLKYRDEAKDEKTKIFWDERVKRKYPYKFEKVVEEVKEEVKHKKEKKVKNGNN